MYKMHIESVTGISHMCHQIRLVMNTVMLYVSGGHFDSIFDFETLYANGA